MHRLSKCLICVICAIALAACHNLHKKTTQAKVQPDGITFDERTIVLTNCTDKDTINAKFIYTNNSDDNIFIDTVRRKCGCIGIEYSHQPVRSHHTGTILVHMDISEVQYFFSQSIIVYFHDYEPIVLKIKGIKKSVDNGRD